MKLKNKFEKNNNQKNEDQVRYKYQIEQHAKGQI